VSAALGWWLQPAVLPWVALVFGLCIGSFLNVVIHRLPKMMEREWRAQCAELAATAQAEGASGPPPAPAADGLPSRYNLVVPRSACPACGRQLRAIENIPVLSWLALRGRCAGCRAPIALRYPVVELAAGLVAAYAAWHFGATLAALGAMFFGWSLIALAAIDLDSQLLPDDITLLLLWVGLAINLRGTFATPASAVLGAIAGYLVLWLVYWGFKLATGKEGMGYGDFKLLAAIGAWLGWAALPLVVLLSSVVGALVGVSLIVLGRQGRDKPIPFGPYLAAAGLIAMFWGSMLSRRWLPILAF
jgi:leader peptidase (prepilin peptidase)/N-methyltransferase